MPSIVLRVNNVLPTPEQTRGASHYLAATKAMVKSPELVEEIVGHPSPYTAEEKDIVGEALLAEINRRQL